MSGKIFYNPNIRQFTPDIIPEIRIKLWLQANTGNEQIEELVRRLHKVLEEDGFTKDPNNPDALADIVSVHAIDDPGTEMELINSLQHDETTVFVYWPTKHG